MIKNCTFQNNEATAELIATAEIESKFWEQEQSNAFTKLANELVVKGFRKGKVPIAIAKKHITELQIEDKALSKFLKNVVQEVAKTLPKDSRVISNPTYKISKISNVDLTIDFIYPTYPKIELCDLTKFPVPYPTFPVVDEQIADRLSASQKNLSMSQTVEGAAKNGHTITVDFKGFIDGEPFPGGESKNFKFELGSGKLIPDLEAGLVGLKTGETKEVAVTFPSDYVAKDLRNQPAKFQVTMKKIEEITLPKVDDDLAKELAIQGVNNLQELKDYFRKQIDEENEQKARKAFENDALTYIAENSKIYIHPFLIKQEVDNLFNEFEGTLKKQNIAMRDYLKFSGATMETIQEQFKDDASMRIKNSFVLQELANIQKFQLTDADFETHFARLADLYKINVEQVRQYVKREQLVQPLLNEKAINYLKELALKNSAEKKSKKIAK